MYAHSRSILEIFPFVLAEGLCLEGVCRRQDMTQIGYTSEITAFCLWVDVLISILHAFACQLHDRNVINTRWEFFLFFAFLAT